MEKYTLYGDNNFKIEKMAQVLHYIISKIGSEPNVGKTFLYKILYFCDFDFYEKNQIFLVGEQYKKLEHGPAPEHFLKAIDYLKQRKLVEQIHTRYVYPQEKYISTAQPDLDKLNAEELLYINNEIDRFKNMNATQISEFSHGDMPWKATERNNLIDYRLAFYRTPVYSVEAGVDDAVD